MFKFGEIVLVKFPFSDNEKSSVRPALILLNGANNDLVCAKITSNLNVDFLYSFNVNFWRESNLLKPSVIRLDKIATFHKSQIMHKIGELISQEREPLKNKFKEVYSEIIN